MRFNSSKIRRIERSGEELLKVFHDYRMHKLLPLKCFTTTSENLPVGESNARFRDPKPSRHGEPGRRVCHPATKPGARSNRCDAFTSRCRARNSFTLMVFSFIPVFSASSSTE